MKQVTPEQVQAAGEKLRASMERKISAMQSAIQDERAAILAANLSREELVDLLAQTTVQLRYAQHDRQVDKDFAAANFNAGWSESDKQAVKRERKPRANGAEKTNQRFKDAKEWTIKEWHKTKHLYPYGKGYSKSRFANHITDRFKGDDLQRNTGIKVNTQTTQTIVRKWLKDQ